MLLVPLPTRNLHWDYGTTTIVSAMCVAIGEHGGGPCREIKEQRTTVISYGDCDRIASHFCKCTLWMHLRSLVAFAPFPRWTWTGTPVAPQARLALSALSSNASWGGKDTMSMWKTTESRRCHFRNSWRYPSIDPSLYDLSPLLLIEQYKDNLVSVRAELRLRDTAAWWVVSWKICFSWA